MGYELDAESRALLATTADGVLLGVVSVSNGRVRLFPTADQAVAFKVTFNTHRQLVAAQAMDATDLRGFSICLQQGQLRWCSVLSVLNRDDPGNMLDRITMEAILLAMSLDRHADFRFFP